MSLVHLDLLLMLFLGLKLRFLVQFCVAQSCIFGSTTPPAAHLHCSHDNKAMLSFSSPPLQNSILLEVSFGGMAPVTALLEFKWQVYQAEKLWFVFHLYFSVLQLVLLYFHSLVSLTVSVFFTSLFTHTTCDTVHAWNIPATLTKQNIFMVVWTAGTE